MKFSGESLLLKRGIALLVDGLILTVIGGFLAGLATRGAPGYSVLLASSSLLIAPVFVLAYFVYFEGASGKTAGKNGAGIRVMKKDCGECGYRESLIRNLLRPVDGFPAFWLVGIASILLTEDNQRIGDIAAGTVVVRDTDDV